MNLAMISTKRKSDVRPEIVAEAESIARESFLGFPVKKISSEIDIDHEGEPVLNLVVEYDIIDQAVDFKSLIPLEKNLRDRVWFSGDQIFVHVRHVFDEKQKFARL